MWSRRLRLGGMTVAILNHNDGCVHEYADDEHQSASDIMFEVTCRWYIGMSDASTAMGSARMGTNAERK